MARHTGRNKNNARSKKNGTVPRQEKRQDENKSITNSAKKTETVARPRKRRCNESENIANSPKKPCTSMKKRDKKYCSTIANSEKLKSIRITPDESEDDFNGFIEGDADENAYWVKRRISILEFAQEIIKNELTSEGQICHLARTGSPISHNGSKKKQINSPHALKLA